MKPARAYRLFALVGLLACSDDSPIKPEVDAQVDAASALPDDGEGEDDVPCTGDIPRHPVGLEVHTSSSGIVAQVMSADFDPPRKYQNSWVITLRDGSGAPVSGAVFDAVQTYMPVHRHNGGFAPTVTEQASTPGSYTFADLYFTMTGPWQVQFSVGTSEATVEPVAIDICVGQ